MRRTHARTVLAAALAATFVCGCARSAEQQTAKTAEHRTLENPSTFPLYPRSQVVTVVPVDSAQMFAAMKASDPKASLPRNFRGHEVIAETGASMDQLRAWVLGLKNSPPSGFHKVVNRDGSSSGTSFGSTQDKDAVGAQFETADGGRSVYVIAADPRKVHQALGPAFTLIDSYSAVPGVMRGAIDDQSKKQLGYSVTEMLDAKSPIGAVVATVKRMQSVDRRAILIIDESRKP
jgi:hypothetical protein